MIRRPPRSTLDRSSAASDVYKRQTENSGAVTRNAASEVAGAIGAEFVEFDIREIVKSLSLIHISEPTRPY